MLRVLSLNIWNFNQWSDRREEVVRWLEELQPDLVGLQEVVRKDDGQCQAHWLGERTAFEHTAFAGGMQLGNVRIGNAVLSRFPIVGSETRPLPSLDAPDEVRVALRADIDTPRGLLSFFTTHLNWQFHHGFVREAQVLEVANFVDDRPSSPLPPILVGDFNAPPDSNEVRFLKGLATLQGKSTYFQDAYEVSLAEPPGFTWSNANPYAAASREPDRRIDYVFVGWRAMDGTGRVLSSSVVCDKPLTGNWASDHFGVLAEVQF